MTGKPGVPQDYGGKRRLYKKQLNLLLVFSCDADSQRVGDPSDIGEFIATGGISHEWVSQVGGG